LLLSLFSGILISRLITEMYMHRGRHFNYFTNISKKIFKKAHFDFIKVRKVTYVISGIFILAGLASFIRGFDYGVEFSGGRSYTIKFDQPHKVSEVREKLHNHLESYPVVKTIGSSDKLNITTDYLIERSGKEVDALVLDKLFTGLKAENLLPADLSIEVFTSKYIEKSDKVEIGRASCRERGKMSWLYGEYENKISG